MDACIHTEPYRRAEKDFDYKLYIMELAMEWVEEKCRVELSRSKLHHFAPSLSTRRVGHRNTSNTSVFPS